MNLLLVPLTIGLPAIDESLDKLLVAMETFPNVAVLGDAIGLARILGLLLARCVGSYECWMMTSGVQMNLKFGLVTFLTLRRQREINRGRAAGNS